MLHSRLSLPKDFPLRLLPRCRRTGSQSFRARRRQADGGRPRCQYGNPIAINEGIRDGLLSEEAMRIAPLRDAADIGDIRPEEQAVMLA